jgi:hypothetical protein
VPPAQGGTSNWRSTSPRNDTWAIPSSGEGVVMIDKKNLFLIFMLCR